MILTGDWTRNHRRLVEGMRRLARFLGGNVESFDDGLADIFVLMMENQPVARLEIGPGCDRRFVFVQIFDEKGK